MFLADAARRVRARGGIIANVDVTLLCEAPKIAPHRDAMRQRIAEMLGIEVEPRRGEGHDHGRAWALPGVAKGIAALATATVILR